MLKRNYYTYSWLPHIFLLSTICYMSIVLKYLPNVIFLYGYLWATLAHRTVFPEKIAGPHPELRAIGPWASVSVYPCLLFRKIFNLK